jgi:hypothetical protein
MIARIQHACMTTLKTLTLDAHHNRPFAQFNIGNNCPAGHFYNMQIIINLTFCGDWAGTFITNCASRAHHVRHIINSSRASSLTHSLRLCVRLELRPVRLLQQLRPGTRRMQPLPPNGKPKRWRHAQLTFASSVLHSTTLPRSATRTGSSTASRCTSTSKAKQASKHIGVILQLCTTRVRALLSLRRNAALHLGSGVAVPFA